MVVESKMLKWHWGHLRVWGPPPTHVTPPYVYTSPAIWCRYCTASLSPTTTCRSANRASTASDFPPSVVSHSPNALLSTWSSTTNGQSRVAERSREGMSRSVVSPSPNVVLLASGSVDVKLHRVQGRAGLQNAIVSRWARMWFLLHRTQFSSCEALPRTGQSRAVERSRETMITRFWHATLWLARKETKKGGTVPLYTVTVINPQLMFESDYGLQRLPLDSSPWVDRWHHGVSFFSWRDGWPGSITGVHLYSSKFCRRGMGSRFVSCGSCVLCPSTAAMSCSNIYCQPQSPSLLLHACIEIPNRSQNLAYSSLEELTATF